MSAAAAASRSWVRAARLAVACLVASSLVAGCGIGGFSGLYNAPLPGGADLGDDPYRVHAEFADVLDLVPQAAVKVNDVPVGRIERVGLSDDNSTALVTMLVNGNVRMPETASAKLRQTSLLGEKFVELAAPAPEQPQPAASPKSAAMLTDGSRIPLQRTNRNPQVEEVLGALSMLLNGGGVAQLQVIIQELNSALSGNEEELRGLFRQLNDVAGRLEAQKENITRAIDGLNRLSASVRAQTDSVEVALNDLGPGIKVIEEQRGQLVEMLRSMDELSAVSVDTINRSKQNLIADLEAVGPTLEKLAETGDKLPEAIGFLSTYPFPEYVMNALKGDFVNSDVYIDLNLDTIIGNITRSRGDLVPIPGVTDDGESGIIPPDVPPIPFPGEEPPPDAPPDPEPEPPSGGGDDGSDGLLGGLLGGD